MTWYYIWYYFINIYMAAELFKIVSFPKCTTGCKSEKNIIRNII